jgi:hypothetical protein
MYEVRADFVARTMEARRESVCEARRGIMNPEIVIHSLEIRIIAVRESAHWKIHSILLGVFAVFGRNCKRGRVK